MSAQDDDFDIGEAMLKKRLEEEEPTFCGNKGRRCKFVFSDCDYHVDRGDAEFHAKRDKELEKG